MDIDAVLQEAIKTKDGAAKACFLIADLAKMAPVYADEGSRDIALAMLKEWEESADALRKGLASAWLTSARAALSGAAARGGAAAGAVKGVASKALAGAGEAAAGVKGAYARVEGKVGDIGAAAGEKYGRSGLTATARRQAEHEGGAAASKRLADRMAPNPKFEMSRAPQRVDGSAPRRGFAMSEGAPSGRMEAPKANPMRDKAMSDQYNIGARNAGNAFAGAHARTGRIAARHAFRAGLAAGAAGAAIGGGAALSQAQHEQRVNAGRHSHDGR